MKSTKLYFDGKFITEVQPLEYPKLYVVPCELIDYPIVVQRAKGYYKGTFTGKVWRVGDDTHCYINVFPTQEAAEMFVQQPIMIGGFGYD